VGSKAESRGGKGKEPETGDDSLCPLLGKAQYSLARPDKH
jgi:hypothetical protein